MADDFKDRIKEGLFKIGSSSPAISLGIGMGKVADYALDKIEQAPTLFNELMKRAKATMNPKPKSPKRK
jgi:hypothetical protein